VNGPETPERAGLPTGVNLAVGEKFPWKGAWWRIVGTIPVQGRNEKSTTGVVIVPEGETMGGAKRRQKGS
jgi:hypothetical protein